MAVRLLTHSIRKPGVRLIPFGSAGAHDTIRSKIGNREIVGYGVNSQPEYVDRPDFPMPSIRWKETTPDIMALREKEKCDWRRLTIEEKKCLYRASFCQTFSEFDAPTGEWKSILATVLILSTFAIVVYIVQHKFVYSKCPLPKSFSDEYQQAQLRRMLDIRVNPITGISSKWDYEKDTWKD